MSLREELERAGLSPDAPNDRGYECQKCGRVPTNIELDRGARCPCKDLELAMNKRDEATLNARARMTPEERDADIAREIFGPGFYSLFGAVKAPDAVESEEEKRDGQ